MYCCPFKLLYNERSNIGVMIISENFRKNHKKDVLARIDRHGKFLDIPVSYSIVLSWIVDFVLSFIIVIQTETQMKQQSP